MNHSKENNLQPQKNITMDMLNYFSWTPKIQPHENMRFHSIMWFVWFWLQIYKQNNVHIYQCFLSNKCHFNVFHFQQNNAYPLDINIAWSECKSTYMSRLFVCDVGSFLFNSLCQVYRLLPNFHHFYNRIIHKTLVIHSLLVNTSIS